MGKKIIFCAGFGAVWALALQLGLKFWLYVDDTFAPLRLFGALLGMMLLLYGGLVVMKKLTGKNGWREALFLVGCGALWSFGGLAAALALADGLRRRQLSAWAMWTFWGYMEVAVLALVVAHSIRREKPLASFALMGSPSGKKAVNIIRLSRTLYYIFLAIPVGILLSIWLSYDAWWAMLLMLLWTLFTLVVYSFLMDKFTNNLLLQKIDPAAFYDVQVWLYQRNRKRTGQATSLLSICAAYMDLDQEEIAAQLLEKMQSEPMMPPHRLLYLLRKVALCKDVASLSLVREAVRSMLVTVKNPALHQQAEVLIAGRQAHLENHPQGLLWYADQVESLPMLANKHNRVAAALSRGDAYLLLGETEKSKAAYSWALQNCGGSLLMKRLAAEGLSKLPFAPSKEV